MRAPPSARFQQPLACVGKCGSVSVPSDSEPAWELFDNKGTVLIPDTSFSPFLIVGSTVFTLTPPLTPTEKDPW